MLFSIVIESGPVVAWRLVVSAEISKTIFLKVKAVDLVHQDKLKGLILK